MSEFRNFRHWGSLSVDELHIGVYFGPPIRANTIWGLWGRGGVHGLSFEGCPMVWRCR